MKIATAKEIDQFTTIVAAQINMRAKASSKPLALFGMATGSIPFMSDVMKKLDATYTYSIDWLTCNGKKPHKYIYSLYDRDQLDLQNSHIIFLDDIFDTGSTYDEVRSFFAWSNHSSLTSFFLLKREKSPFPDNGTCFYGFQIPTQEWAYGYGMDDRKGFRRNQQTIHTTWYEREEEPEEPETETQNSESTGN